LSHDLLRASVYRSERKRHQQVAGFHLFFFIGKGKKLKVDCIQNQEKKFLSWAPNDFYET